MKTKKFIATDQNHLLAVASFGVHWAPLRAKLGDDGCEPFMFMASYTPDGSGTVVHSYKHRDTRRYLNLDEDGQCYCYRAGGYAPTNDESALNHVFG